jgi:mono/diheme cytochrome c family protein
MKKSLISHITAFVIIAGLFIVFVAFKSANSNFQEESNAKIEIPKDIGQIMDKSCFGCHNADAKSEDARDALMIDELPYLKTHKIVAKLDEIAATVKDGDMPPSKFLKKYPEKALSDEEAAKLSDWALNTAEELMK